MRVDRFDFHLPKERIATEPLEPRDASRLLEVLPAHLHDRTVRDLPSLLRKGDILVFNDTRVIPARLKGKRGTASVEITLHKKSADGGWKAFARPAKKLKPGDVFTVAEGFHATIIAKHEDGEVSLEFNREGAALEAALERYGSMPLPPYLSRPAMEKDKETYQTVYAKKHGAVAAPTARAPGRTRAGGHP